MKSPASILLVISAWSVLQACAGHPGQKAHLRELMELSGLQQQVDQIPAHAFSFLEEEKERLPPVQYALLTRVFQETYDTNKLLSGVQDRIEINFDAAYAGRALEWMRSPLAQKITRLEQDSSAPQALEQMQVLAEELRITPAPEPRLKLIRQLDKATRGTEMATDMVILSAWGVELGLNALLPAKGRSTPDMLLRQAAFAHSQIIREQKEIMKIGFLYTYQTLADSEIERYADFAESGAGQWYYRTIRQAFKDVLSKAALDTGKGVDRGLPEPP
ncbi:MAG: hypothetical protein AABY87_03675 [bacterium]